MVRSNENDVRLYLQDSLRARASLSDWTSDVKLEESIIEAILPRLSGMFLLARLYVDLLTRIPTIRGVRKVLNDLPNGLDNTYAEAWKRICSQSLHQAELGKKVISWIVCATRPFRVEELQDGLAIKVGDSEFDKEGVPTSGNLTSFCAGLVVIDEQSNQISLVHPTANEYFVGHKEELFPVSHDQIAIACTSYLLMDSLKHACSEPDDFTARHRKNRFFGYAAVNWGFHVRASTSQKAFELAQCLVQHEPARVAAVQGLMLNTLGASERLPEWPVLSTAETKERPDRYNEEFYNSTKSVSAVHLAAYFGLVELVDNLLEAGEAVNTTDEMGATAVHWAILGDQNEMLESFLQRGGHPQSYRQPYHIRRWHTQGSMFYAAAGETYPLHLAASLGNVSAIKVLLRHGADVNNLSKPSKQVYYQRVTALTAALACDQAAAAELLLTSGVDVNRDTFLIEHVIMLGHLDTLRWLLSFGVSSYHLNRAFCIAAHDCRYEVMAILLKAGAEVSCESLRIDNANRRATASTRNDAHLRKQGNVGKEVEVADQDHETSLDDKDYFPYAVTNPLISVVESAYVDEMAECASLLISSGLDVNCIDYCTYLYRDDWTLSGNPSVCDTDTDIKGHWKNPLVRRRTTPLHSATYFRDDAMIDFLIGRGAKLNVVINRYYTILTSALHGEGCDGYKVRKTV